MGGGFVMEKRHIAGILSLLVPGIGQMYNGKILRGVLWLIFTGVSWIGSVGTLGIFVHLLCAWCAYNYARKRRR